MKQEYMREALAEARLAAAENETPIGAVIVQDNRIIARAHNQRESLCDPTAHAEILALRRASQVLGRRRLTDCELYVTLEPCPMCAGAMLLSCLGRCYFGATDERQGCCESVYALPQDPAFYHHVPCVGGLLAEESAALMKDFFEARRPNTKEKNDLAD